MLFYYHREIMLEGKNQKEKKINLGPNILQQKNQNLNAFGQKKKKEIILE